MQDKVRTLEQAAALISDGQQIVMSGRMACSPMALLRRLVADGRKGLRLVGVVGAAINADLLVGAEAVASVDTCSMTLGRYARTGPNFSRHVQSGRVIALDNT